VSTKPIGSRKLLGSCPKVRISSLLDGPPRNGRRSAWFKTHAHVCLGILFWSCDATCSCRGQRSLRLAVGFFGRSTTALGRNA
jgi:hypothetical protein